ncbi:hypothetical protein NDU88_010325 [Pleurodeles waltl]|uniref:Uncharacterized protein n=1 Tax=Pleurodeles waltl TaxID=8319 RepID=A0AAV7PYD4_PLEWA|nr:hypothetical protein NDU88_010325 [Pleurodeles waltl]
MYHSGHAKPPPWHVPSYKYEKKCGGKSTGRVALRPDPAGAVPLLRPLFTDPVSPSGVSIHELRLSLSLALPCFVGEIISPLWCDYGFQSHGSAGHRSQRFPSAPSSPRPCIRPSLYLISGGAGPPRLGCGAGGREADARARLTGTCREDGLDVQGMAPSVASAQPGTPRPPSVQPQPLLSRTSPFLHISNMAKYLCAGPGGWGRSPAGGGGSGEASPRRWE